MIQLVPILVTQADWPKLLAVAGRALGRSLTSSVDMHNWGIAETRSIVAALGEFQKPGTPAPAVLREHGSLLRHVMVSFLVVASREVLYEVAVDGSLRILDCERDDLAIVSGTLEDWRVSVVRFCSDRATQRQREFHYKAYEALDRMGLSGLFGDYSPRHGAMILVKK